MSQESPTRRTDSHPEPNRERREGTRNPEPARSRRELAHSPHPSSRTNRSGSVAASRIHARGLRCRPRARLPPETARSNPGIPASTVPEHADDSPSKPLHWNAHHNRSVSKSTSRLRARNRSPESTNRTCPVTARAPIRNPTASAISAGAGP